MAEPVCAFISAASALLNGSHAMTAAFFDETRFPLAVKTGLGNCWFGLKNDQFSDLANMTMNLICCLLCGSRCQIHLKNINLIQVYLHAASGILKFYYHSHP
jgi:hypothetical protein